MKMNKKTYQAPRTKTFILHHEQHLLDASSPLDLSSNTLGWGGQGSDDNGGSEACSRGGDWGDE